MFYILKWRPRGISEPIIFPGRFDSVTQAILEGCEILAKGHDDVWIEDQAGVKVVDAAQIAEYCPPPAHGTGRL